MQESVFLAWRDPSRRIVACIASVRRRNRGKSNCGAAFFREGGNASSESRRGKPFEPYPKAPDLCAGPRSFQR